MMTIKCGECGETHSLDDVNKDRIRFYRKNRCVRFGPGTTQEKIDNEQFLCELCQEERFEAMNEDTTI